MKIACIGCGKEVAETKEIIGITTWFPVCSECLFNIKGWTKKDIDAIIHKHTPLGGGQNGIITI